MNENLIPLAIFYCVVSFFAGTSTLFGTSKFYKGSDPGEAILGFFITFFFWPFFIVPVFYRSSSNNFWDNG